MKPYAIVPEPVHEPALPVSCEPCSTVPATVGAAELDGPAGGAAAATSTAPLRESWTAVPAVAWTTASSLWLLSSAVTT